MPTQRLVKKYPRCGCRDEVDMKEIRLYDYQAEMKVRIDTAFRSYQSVMVQMPTGTEKSKRFILSENVEECDALYDLYYDGENPPIFKKRKKSYEL